MLSNTLKSYLNSFPIRNNIIIPSTKTFEKMNMTRQEYIFYKWSHHRNLRSKKLNGSNDETTSKGGTTSNVRNRRLV